MGSECVKDDEDGVHSCVRSSYKLFCDQLPLPVTSLINRVSCGPPVSYRLLETSAGFCHLVSQRQAPKGHISCRPEQLFVACSCSVLSYCKTLVSAVRYHHSHSGPETSCSGFQTFGR